MKMAISAFLLLTATALVIVTQFSPRLSQIQFDENDWKRWTEGDAARPSIRQQMVVDLVQRLLPGKNASAIRDLLGESEYSTIWVGEEPQKQPGSSELYYDLGFPVLQGWRTPAEVAAYDDEILIVYIDASGTYRGWSVFSPNDWSRLVDKRARKTYVN